MRAGGGRVAGRSYVAIAAVAMLLGACERDAAPPSRPLPPLTIRPELKGGASFRVVADAEQVMLEAPNFPVERMRWSEVQKISIVTTDEGPRLTDVFIVLEGRTSRLVVPQDARGSDDFAGLLVRVEGFDLEAFVRSMGSAENASFVCWTGKRVQFGAAAP